MTWFALMSLGMLIGALGLVGLIVGIVRRRSASRGPPTLGYAGAAGTFAQRAARAGLVSRPGRGRARSATGTAPGGPITPMPDESRWTA